MAGYIEWSKGLANKREVVVMAAMLKRDRHEIAGRLMTFWEWCDDNIDEVDIDHETGHAVIQMPADRDATAEFIDGKCGLPGVTKALASRAVSWLKFAKNGQVFLLNFARHNGSTAKTRIRNAKNQAKKRQRDSESASSAFGDEKVTTQPNPTQPNPTHGKGSVGRSEDSLEGVQGEIGPIEFESLLRVEDRHLNITADLCAIHRAAHAEHPESVPATEGGLLAVIGAANRAKKKARSSRSEFFRGIFRKRKLATIHGQELADAAVQLDAYRSALKKRRESGVSIEDRQIPLCDASETES